MLNVGVTTVLVVAVALVVVTFDVDVDVAVPTLVTLQQCCYNSSGNSNNGNSN